MQGFSSSRASVARIESLYSLNDLLLRFEKLHPIVLGFPLLLDRVFVRRHLSFSLLGGIVDEVDPLRPRICQCDHPSRHAIL